MTLVLGLGGKPHSGKTMAADALTKAHFNAKVYSISDLICEELGVTRSHVKDARILQDHGQSRREEDPLYWVCRIEKRIVDESPEVAIIPNIRAFTEVDMVRRLCGRLIRYTRLNPDGTCYAANDRDMNHPLETALDNFNWDHYITVKQGESPLLEAWTLALVAYLRLEM